MLKDRNLRYKPTLLIIMLVFNQKVQFKQKITADMSRLSSTNKYYSLPIIYFLPGLIIRADKKGILLCTPVVITYTGCPVVTIIATQSVIVNCKAPVSGTLVKMAEEQSGLPDVGSEPPSQLFVCSESVHSYIVVSRLTADLQRRRVIGKAAGDMNSGFVISQCRRSEIKGQNDQGNEEVSHCIYANQISGR